MNIKIIGVTAAVSLLLGACTDQFLVDDVSNMNPKESGFKADLHRNYSDLAKAELSEKDLYDSGVFARRAEAAAMGKDVDPDILWDRDYTSGNFDTLSGERARLMRALDGGGREKLPNVAATAQTQFDCWAQELEENYQPDDIANCRNGYEVAVGKLEEGLKPKPVAKVVEPPKPAPAPAPTPPQVDRKFLLFFDFDSAKLTEDAQAIIQVSVDASRQISVSMIEAIGHTDSAGADGYNLTLSERRANAVKAELIRLGIAADDVATIWKGEREALVQTADGVREPQNRRVEIVLK